MASSAMCHLICIVFVVVLGVLLSRASPLPELGLVIHPAFSPPIFVLKNQETLQEDSRVKDEAQTLAQTQDAACELNITESGFGLHEFKTVAKKSFSFFVKPEKSFKKLVFKLSLQNIFYMSGDFHSDEEITLSSEDMARSRDKQQWTHVRVKHFKFERKGLDRHGFKVSFGNMTRSIVTHDSWFIKGFKGFTVFAEGASKVLFNCAPSSLEEPPKRSYVFYSMWVMAGLLIVATFLLASLCVVWVYLRQQRKKKKAPFSPTMYPVFEEFDEVMLDKIKQKVEALRSGKTVSDTDTVVVGCPLRQENIYMELDGGDQVEHHYEDIDKDYRQRFAADSMHQNHSNVDSCNQDTYATENIYESFPGYEEYMERRGNAAKTSARYYLS